MLYLRTPEVGSQWGRTDRAQARGGGQQVEWAMSRARQQREGWAGQREGWRGPEVDMWVGVEAREDLLQALAGQAHLPQVSGLPPSPCSLVSHLGAFAPAVPSAWNALTWKTSSQFSYHFLPEAPLPYTHDYRHWLQ